MTDLTEAVRVRLDNRRGHWTVCIGDPLDPQERPPFDIGFGFFPGSWHVAELFMWSGTKIGEDIDTILVDVFIGISRGLQERPYRELVTVDPVKDLVNPDLAVPIEVTLHRHAHGLLADDLAVIGLRAPDHPGLDRKLILLAAELTMAVTHLPAPAGRAAIQGVFVDLAGPIP